MINLLPPSVKQDYVYARRNVALMRWLVACGLACVGLIAIGTAGYIYLQDKAAAYDPKIAHAHASLQTKHLAKAQTEAADISGDLKLAVKVLSQEVLFSKLLRQLGTVTPSNVSLSGITISQTVGALDITAQSTDYNAAAQLAANISDPDNRIFSKADIVNTSCDAKKVGPYKCDVTIRALFANDNPFLFISNDKGSKS